MQWIDAHTAKSWKPSLFRSPALLTANPNWPERKHTLDVKVKHCFVLDTTLKQCLPSGTRPRISRKPLVLSCPRMLMKRKTEPPLPSVSENGALTYQQQSQSFMFCSKTILDARKVSAIVIDFTLKEVIITMVLLLELCLPADHHVRHHLHQLLLELSQNQHQKIRWRESWGKKV